MYYLLYTINALLMLVPPIIVGILIARKRGIGWSVFIAGGVTFIVSQVGHIPFNGLILPKLNNQLTRLPDTAALFILAIFLGLSSGVFEEVARYLTYTYWRKDARTWGSGMMLGAGHGGTEAIIVGIGFASTFFMLAAYNLGWLPNLLSSVPAEQLPEAQALVQGQINDFFTAPWYATILGGLERLFSITFHLSASLLVMQSVIQGKYRWLLLSVYWHAFTNAGAIIIIGLTDNGYLAELFLFFVALVSLFIIRHFKQPEPVEPEPEPLPPPLKDIDLSQIEPTTDNLESSRYV